MLWHEAPEIASQTRAGRRVAARFAPIALALLISTVMASKGEWWRALAVLALLAVVFQVRAVAPSAEHRFNDGLRAIGHGIGTAIGFVCLSAAFIVISLTSLFTWRTRRAMAAGGWGPLGPPGPSASAWEGAEPLAIAGPSRGESTGTRRAPTSRAVRILGIASIIVIADLLLGAGLTGTGLLPPEDRGDLRTATIDTMSTTLTAPPIAREPWAKQYASELIDYELSARGVEPFLITGFHPFNGTYLNVTDEERVSYEPKIPSGAKPLRVAFFGGSVMFGVGQRDDHTIPSEFARIAKAHGVPVEVHNYGRSAWVSWQEQLYFEQLLAHGHRYDLVIFLDGFNEFEIQKFAYSADPTHVAADTIAGLVDDFRSKRQTEPGTFDGLAELADSYHRNSGTWRIADSLAGHRQPFGGEAHSAQGTPQQQADAALDIYQRSRNQIDALADRHRVPVRYFWQPRQRGWDDETLARLPKDITSLASVFDGRQQDLYIDDVHTNEVGARLLAQAIWDDTAAERRAGRR